MPKPLDLAAMIIALESAGLTRAENAHAPKNTVAGPPVGGKL